MGVGVEVPAGGVRTCQHAMTVPPGVATILSSTACTGQSCRPTSRTFHSSSVTPFMEAGMGSCRAQQAAQQAQQAQRQQAQVSAPLWHGASSMPVSVRWRAASKQQRALCKGIV